MMNCNNYFANIRAVFIYSKCFIIQKVYQSVFSKELEQVDNIYMQIKRFISRNLFLLLWGLASTKVVRQVFRLETSGVGSEVFGQNFIFPRETSVFAFKASQLFGQAHPHYGE